MSSSKTASALGFHEGATLVRVANNYPRLLEVVLEAVQNAIDSGAKMIGISINQRARTLTVQDNGEGASLEKFEQALKTVGHTMKKSPDALGRFGIGLVSPVGKCERYTFTSCPKGTNRSYLTWTFDTSVILEQSEVRIPYASHPEFLFGTGDSNKRQQYVWWRTQVRLEKYASDRWISQITMESLVDGISSKFNTAMRRKNVEVRITLDDESGVRRTHTVEPQGFTGESLGDVFVSNPECGKTTFRMYLAKKSSRGRLGKVLVGEDRNDFRITFQMFQKSLPEGIKISDAAVAALTSGVFEGEILSARARFHANRRGFEPNDALVGFCVAIDEWFANHGSKHYKEIQEAREDERYQELGLRSLRAIEELLKSEEGRELLPVIERFKRGNIGEGHVPRSGREEMLTSLTTKAAPLPSPLKDKESSSHNQEPENEKKAHHPYTVVGPRGKKRTEVRSNSLGLRLIHEALQGNILWDLDISSGTLILNIRHPLWVRCSEASDKILMRFQEHLMIQALGVQAMPEDYRDIGQMLAEETAKPMVFMLIYGDKLTGRVAVKKPVAEELQKQKKAKLTPKSLVFASAR